MNADSTANALPTLAYAPLSTRAAHGHRARTLERESTLIDHAPGSIGRREVEAFIRDEYRAHFDADVKHFMPRLIALRSGPGILRAVVGCRGAATGPLFLETYTRDAIERVIAERLGADVPREQIVEVGSLACRDGRAALEIVRAVIPALIGAGFTWVVFTGADTVRNVFRVLNLVPHALCSADKSMLGADREDWGSYYDHHPIVMAGRLADGLRVARSIPGVQR